MILFYTLQCRAAIFTDDETAAQRKKEGVSYSRDLESILVPGGELLKLYSEAMRPFSPSESMRPNGIYLVPIDFDEVFSDLIDLDKVSHRTM